MAQEYEYVEGSGTKIREVEPEQDNEALAQALAKQGMSKKDLQVMIEELKNNNPENFEKINSGKLSKEESEALMQEMFSNLPEETLKKLTGGSGGLTGAKVEQVMEKGLSSIRNVPYDVAYKHIKEKVDKSKAAPIIKKIPKSYTFLTNFLRDEQAPKMFFNILKDKQRLTFFAFASISLIVIGFLIKRRRKNKNLPFGEAFVQGFSHFFIFTGLKVGVFFYFFHPEIAPVWRIIRQTYN